MGRLGTPTFPQGPTSTRASAWAACWDGSDATCGREKRRPRHVDHLLAHARVRGALLMWREERVECTLNRLVFQAAEGRATAAGFGASDCRCTAHPASLGSRWETAWGRIVAGSAALAMPG